MYCIKSNSMIDFLWESGCYPDYEEFGYAFYRTGTKLRELLDRYYIIHECIPNKLGGY